MLGEQSLGERLDAILTRHVGGPVPEHRTLPWYCSPLPTWLENVAFRLVWLLVAINLAGTAFGFIFYGPQLTNTPVVMWPLVPVSPLSTLYIAISLACWRLDYDGRIAQIIHILAFIGCLKYGLWSVFVQIVVEDTGPIPYALWQFLIWSHAGMVVQAFLIPRYARFPLSAVTLGSGWYVLNDLFDYFVSILGGPHHTRLNINYEGGELVHPSPESELLAGSAIITTVLAIALTVAVYRAVSD